MTETPDPRLGVWVRARLAVLLAAALLVVGGVAAAPPPGSPGQIYVADQRNNRIVRMDDMAGAGWTTFGIDGTLVNQFAGPVGTFAR